MVRIRFYLNENGEEVTTVNDCFTGPKKGWWQLTESLEGRTSRVARLAQTYRRNGELTRTDFICHQDGIRFDEQERVRKELAEALLAAAWLSNKNDVY